MQQISRGTGTPSFVVSNVRLDPEARARLDWIQKAYSQQGETLSTSVVLRRALQVLEAQLSQAITGQPQEMDTEMRHALSVARGKPFPGSPKDYPWTHSTEPLKPFKSYASL